MQFSRRLHNLSREVLRKEESLSKFGQAAIKSRRFKDLTTEQLTWEATHSVDDYLTLLSTSSLCIKLERHKQKALIADLKKVLARNGITSISVSYLSALQVAQKARICNGASLANKFATQ
ncbi:hypothetical protein [Chroococcidiopsis sp. TS-821]|uniref:hypothetical protein n=1 Tax=Chroococcidiopsis sp. TS-821 TaxID=1378066 RepID=UPI000CEDDDE9|nr:hypothetical protein [Chroococcidiopsis sp. TS-821]PPS44928.1 hypothetical protein B1A85_01200 [Chroococcidiopsis sp. TS-821]